LILALSKGEKHKQKGEEEKTISKWRKWKRDGAFQDGGHESRCSGGGLEYYYLTLERARLAVIVLGARIVAVESFPTCRAGATAVHRVAFRSIETRTAIAAIGAPFVLKASCLWKNNKNKTD
jgi:hypothetical protein